MKHRIIKLVGLILVAAFLYTYFFPSTAALKIPIKEQLKALQIEDYVTAYSYTTENFQKNTSLEAFKNFINSYSGLRNNQDIRFEQRSIRNHGGLVKAILVARGGKTTPITYRLINENDQWKIEAMQISADMDEDTAPRPDDTTKPISTANISTTNNVSTTPAAPVAPVAAKAPAPQQNDNVKIYSDAKNNFSMEYPVSWEFTATDNGTIIFQKKDSNDNQIMLTVQPVIINDGEAAPGVQQVLDFGEDAIRQKSTSYKIVEDGLLPSGANKNENYHGRYVVYSYNQDGRDMKQLQVVYFRSPKHAQFVVDYISPEKSFDANLPTARAMIASFQLGRVLN